MADKPRCPICKESVAPLSENDSFPFCSKRCKQRDLGKWFGEEYRMPLTPSSTERNLEATEESDDNE